jgi:6-phosphofructo-2-kinase/fructose-2,6-biphosphatase 2
MNLHLVPREFYLTRHGQSEYNLSGKIGGDSGLTEAGLEYARRLADFAKDVVAKKVEIDEKTGKEIRTDRPARLWTSTLKRTKETAQFIKREPKTFKWDNGDECE